MDQPAKFLPEKNKTLTPCKLKNTVNEPSCDTLRRETSVKQKQAFFVSGASMHCTSMARTNNNRRGEKGKGASNHQIRFSLSKVVH